MYSLIAGRFCEEEINKKNNIKSGNEGPNTEQDLSVYVQGETLWKPWAPNKICQCTCKERHYEKHEHRTRSVSVRARRDIMKNMSTEQDLSVYVQGETLWKPWAPNMICQCTCKERHYENPEHRTWSVSVRARRDIMKNMSTEQDLSVYVQGETLWKPWAPNKICQCTCKERHYENPEHRTRSVSVRARRDIMKTMSTEQDLSVYVQGETLWKTWAPNKICQCTCKERHYENHEHRTRSVSVRARRDIMKTLNTEQDLSVYVQGETLWKPWAPNKICQCTCKERHYENHEHRTRSVSVRARRDIMKTLNTEQDLSVYVQGETLWKPWAPNKICQCTCKERHYENPEHRTRSVSVRARRDIMKTMSTEQDLSVYVQGETLWKPWAPNKICQCTCKERHYENPEHRTRSVSVRARRDIMKNMSTEQDLSVYVQGETLWKPWAPNKICQCTCKERHYENPEHRTRSVSVRARRDIMKTMSTEQDLSVYVQGETLWKTWAPNKICQCTCKERHYENHEHRTRSVSVRARRDIMKTLNTEQDLSVYVQGETLWKPWAPNKICQCTCKERHYENHEHRTRSVSVRARRDIMKTLNTEQDLSVYVQGETLWKPWAPNKICQCTCKERHYENPEHRTRSVSVRARRDIMKTMSTEQDLSVYVQGETLWKPWAPNKICQCTCKERHYENPEHRTRSVSVRARRDIMKTMSTEQDLSVYVQGETLWKPWTPNKICQCTCKERHYENDEHRTRSVSVCARRDIMKTMSTEQDLSVYVQGETLWKPWTPNKICQCTCKERHYENHEHRTRSVSVRARRDIMKTLNTEQDLSVYVQGETLWKPWAPNKICQCTCKERHYENHEHRTRSVSVRARRDIMKTLNTEQDLSVYVQGETLWKPWAPNKICQCTCKERHYENHEHRTRSVSVRARRDIMKTLNTEQDLSVYVQGETLWKPWTPNKICQCTCKERHYENHEHRTRSVSVRARRDIMKTMSTEQDLSVYVQGETLWKPWTPNKICQCTCKERHYENHEHRTRSVSVRARRDIMKTMSTEQDLSVYVQGETLWKPWAPNKICQCTCKERHYENPEHRTRSVSVRARRDIMKTMSTEQDLSVYVQGETLWKPWTPNKICQCTCKERHYENHEHLTRSISVHARRDIMKTLSTEHDLSVYVQGETLWKPWTPNKICQCTCKERQIMKTLNTEQDLSVYVQGETLWKPWALNKIYKCTCKERHYENPEHRTWSVSVRARRDILKTLSTEQDLLVYVQGETDYENPEHRTRSVSVYAKREITKTLSREQQTESVEDSYFWFELTLKEE